jgi:DNA-binding LacI/PurR family transcriptional regulator
MPSKRRHSSPTQADVAKLAGVSRTTVSYVLSNNTTVSIPEETRERIWKAAEELNYTPHTQAQRLRSGKTRTITMLYPWDDVSTQIELEFLTGAARAATEEEYFFNLITAPMTEQSLLNLYRGRQTDGLILMQVRLHDWRVDLLRESDYPFVLIGSCEDNTGLSFVDIDYETAIFTAFEHLVELGHEHIGLLTFPARWRHEGNTAPVQCMRAFEKARQELSITAGVREVPYSAEGMYQGFIELLDEIPELTGLVVSYAATLGGVYRAAFERGLQIPDDLSIVGIAGETSAGLLVPALTGFDSQNFTRGYRAAKILLRMLQTDDFSPEQVFLPFDLIVRETTTHPRTKKGKQDHATS